VGVAYKKQVDFAKAAEAYKQVLGLQPYNAENYEKYV
jgi:hypothetical protein